MRGKALVPLLEGIGYPAERLAQVCSEQFPIGQVFGHFAKPVHVIAEGHEPGLAVFRLGADHRLERAAHQRRAQHFLESADMREAAGTIASFEQDRRAIGFDAVRITFEQALCLLKWPGLGHACGFDQFGHAHGYPSCRKPALSQVRSETSRAANRMLSINYRAIVRALCKRSQDCYCAKSFWV